MIGITMIPAEVFVPKSGTMLWLLVAAMTAVSILFLVILTQVPSRYRKPMVMAATFICGWFYLVEFAIPSPRDAVTANSYLRKAEFNLRLAEHSITPHYGDPRGRVDPKINGGAERIKKARESVDKAHLYLSKAAEEIARIRVLREKDYIRACDEAERFKNRYGLTEKMIERSADDHKIIDLRTKALKKRVSDLGEALSKIKENDEAVMSAAAGLSDSSASKQREARDVLSAAADGVALIRTSISDNFLTKYQPPASNILSVIYGFSIGLGILSLMTIHGKNIAKARPGYYNSIAFYAALIIMAVAAFLNEYWKSAPSFVKPMFQEVLFNGALTSLQATMFSLVAFYIVSAAYRAFRIKSAESALMMAAAFIVMLGIVPVGVAMTSGLHGNLSWLRLDNIQNWIMTVPNMAAQRGMAFGIGVGGLAMALRIWLSLERGSYFDKQM